MYFVAVPGNHDCDFDRIGAARDMILDGVLKDPNSALDPSIVQVCTQVQEPFYEFLNANAHESRLDASALDTLYDHKLYYEYRFSAQGDILRFMCCNTPWLSRLREIPGQLYFPADAIPSITTEPSLSIAMFHHPYPWLEPNNRRSFQKRVEEVADIVLTGHEHEATRKTQQGDKGERNTYIEGGALHDAEYFSNSVFNAFIIDTETKKQKFTRLVWDVERYSPSVSFLQGKDGAGLAWEELQINRLRQGPRFDLSVKALSMLDDAGVYLTHRHRGILKLSDIYVFPDLRDTSFAKDTQPSVVRGEHILDLVARKPHLLLTGDTQCGKTSLAKMLFWRLHDGGEVPLLFPSDRRPPTDDSLFGYLEDIFSEQYDATALTAYRQMDRTRRLIIIDDYHKLPLSASTKKKFMANLARFAGRIILIANDAVLLEALAAREEPASSLPTFSQYRIQPFGHLRRNRLIEKWLLLNSEADTDGTTFAHQLTIITRQLDTLIGKNFVPAYPIYLLSVLQASEAALPIDLNASTHGYFYEILIKVALAQGKTQIDFDVIATYLRHLAYYFFSNRMKEMDEATFRQVHALYEGRYDLSRSFEKIRDALIEKQMLAQTGSSFRFRHRYLYYFFVASYMRDHLNLVEVRQHLRNLSRALYLEENANILLFLAHLSKDPVIVDEMLSASQDHYKNFVPIHLGDDANFLNEFENVKEEFVYEEKDPKTTREEILEAMDKDTSAISDEPDSPEILDPASPIAQVNAAFKTLQILGQILKNFPGSLETPVKLDIARACVGLGKRINSFVFQLIRENEHELVQDIGRMIRERFPNAKNEELQRKARETVVGMAKVISYGLVKRVSHAIGSPLLTNTYDRLVKESPDNATRLVEVSTRLDHSGEFPDDQIKILAHDMRSSHIPLWILRGLIVQHFYLFPVDYRKKQRVCEALGISYSRLQAADPSRKLISSSKTEQEE